MGLNLFPGPSCCVWEITRKCNFRCKHCGVTAGFARENELTRNEAQELCSELNDIGCRGVALLGGEIFLRPDWFEIAKKIRSYGMDLSIISNGWLINHDAISQIRSLDCKSFAISLDGRRHVHDKIRKKGSFDRCLKAIDLALDNDIPTSVITTLSKSNVKELTGLRDILVEKDISWQIQVATPHGSRMKQNDMLSIEQYLDAASH